MSRSSNSTSPALNFLPLFSDYRKGVGIGEMTLGSISSTAKNILKKKIIIYSL